MNTEYLPPLGNHLWQSTLFAGVAALLTLTLRNNSASVRHGIWLAASCKFLIPVSLLIALGGAIGWRLAPETAASNLSVAMEEFGQPFSAPRASSPPVADASPSIALPMALADWLPWPNGFVVRPLAAHSLCRSSGVLSAAP